MYVQITTRCQMTCEHCMFACTNVGEDMNLRTFRKALEYCDDSIAIGGGEPTIHPYFWEIIGLSLGNCDDVWLATNGANTKIAIMLANMAKRGVLGCDLSKDSYHDEIDDKVEEAFGYPEWVTNGGRRRMPHHYDHITHDRRDIRCTEESLIDGGRCDFGVEDKCCGGEVCMPDGKVRQCACLDAPIIGDVFTGYELHEGTEWGECHKYEQEES